MRICAKLLGMAWSVLFFGMVGCSSIKPSEPGTGPGFDSLNPPMDVETLFIQFSTDAENFSTISLEGGEQDCPLGGTVDETVSFTGLSVTASLDYHDCKFEIDGLTYTANGTLELSEDQNDKATFEQHMTFSGDLGFAANCDYSQTVPTGENVSGECAYVDSTGKELTIDADGIDEII